MKRNKYRCTIFEVTTRDILLSANNLAEAILQLELDKELALGISLEMLPHLTKNDAEELDAAGYLDQEGVYIPGLANIKLI